jgi:hypothetical protein
MEETPITLTDGQECYILERRIRAEFKRGRITLFIQMFSGEQRIRGENGVFRLTEAVGRQ